MLGYFLHLPLAKSDWLQSYLGMGPFLGNGIAASRMPLLTASWEIFLSYLDLSLGRQSLHCIWILLSPSSKGIGIGDFGLALVFQSHCSCFYMVWYMPTGKNTKTQGYHNLISSPRNQSSYSQMMSKGCTITSEGIKVFMVFRFDYHSQFRWARIPTWRIIPISKWLVAPIHKPFRPFVRGTTLLRKLTNHGY